MVFAITSIAILSITLIYFRKKLVKKNTGKISNTVHELKDVTKETITFIKKEKLTFYDDLINWFFKDRFITSSFKLIILLFLLITTFYFIFAGISLDSIIFSLSDIIGSSFIIISWVMFGIMILTVNDKFKTFLKKQEKRERLLPWLLLISILLIFSMILLPGINYILFFALFFGFFLIDGMGFFTIGFLIYQYLIYTHQGKPSNKAYYSREKFDLIISLSSFFLFLFIFFVLLTDNLNLFYYLDFSSSINTSIEYGKVITKGFFWVSITFLLVFIIQPYILRKYYRKWSSLAFLPFILLGMSLSALYYSKSIESISYDMGNFLDPVGTSLGMSNMFNIIFMVFSVILLFTGFLSLVKKYFPKELPAKFFILWLFSLVIVELGQIIETLPSGEVWSVGIVAMPLVLIYCWPAIILFFYIVLSKEIFLVICPHCGTYQLERKNCKNKKKNLIVDIDRVSFSSRNVYVREARPLAFIQYLFIAMGLLTLLLLLGVWWPFEYLSLEYIWILIISILFFVLGIVPAQVNKLFNSFSKTVGKYIKQIKKRIFKKKKYHHKNLTQNDTNTEFWFTKRQRGSKNIVTLHKENCYFISPQYRLSEKTEKSKLGEFNNKDDAVDALIKKFSSLENLKINCNCNCLNKK